MKKEGWVRKKMKREGWVRKQETADRKEMFSYNLIKQPEKTE